MQNSLSFITYLCDDYDKAKDWLSATLGFVCLEDTALEGGKRWLRMAATEDAQTGLLIAKASSPEQISAIGKQFGGRVGFFLNTDSFDQMYAGMFEKGVKFREVPREEPYGKVVVFEDLYGQPWDLLQLKVNK